MRFNNVEGKKSPKTSFCNKKRDKKYLHSRNYSEYDFESFFFLAFHLNSIFYTAKKNSHWFLCMFVLKLFNDTKQRNKIIIDEFLFFFLSKGENNNIYRFSVSHKFSISTVTFLFVLRHLLFEVQAIHATVE